MVSRTLWALRPNRRGASWAFPIALRSMVFMGSCCKGRSMLRMYRAWPESTWPIRLPSGSKQDSSAPQRSLRSLLANLAPAVHSTACMCCSNQA